jgi:hypothetical protein
MPGFVAMSHSIRRHFVGFPDELLVVWHANGVCGAVSNVGDVGVAVAAAKLYT